MKMFELIRMINRSLQEADEGDLGAAGESESPEDKTLNERFKDEKVAVYTSKITWDIRPGNPRESLLIDNKKKRIKIKPGQYVARQHDDIENVKVLDKDEVMNTFEPVRDNQKPDAEGFMLYRDTSEIEAYEYFGKATQLSDDNGMKYSVRNGDYISRYVDDPETFFIITSGDMKMHYRKMPGAKIPNDNNI